MGKRGDQRDHMLELTFTPPKAKACRKHECCDCIAYERQWYYERMDKIEQVLESNAFSNPRLYHRALSIIQDIARGAHPKELADRLHAIGLGVSVRPHAC